MHAFIRGLGAGETGGRRSSKTIETTRPHWRTTLALLVTGTVVLGACSSDRFTSADVTVPLNAPAVASERQESTATAIGLATGKTAADTGTVNQADADRIAAATSIPAQTPSALTNRKIIRTAQVTLEVTNVPDATAKLRNAVSAAGGFLGSEEASYGISDQVTLTFRIPVGQFDTMINRLSKFGSVLSTSIASEEVTNQYRDLESRLRSKKISAERLRQLITQAVKPADILLIEHELSDREAEIESMQGQLNVLGDQTSLSTITLTLVSKGNSVVVAPVKTQEPSFRRAWRRSVNSLGDIAQALAAAAGGILPFTPILLILLAALIALKRRSTKRSGVQTMTNSRPLAPMDHVAQTTATTAASDQPSPGDS